MKSPIVYCNCTHATIIPERVKGEVLERLRESGTAVEVVSDLCERAARRDAILRRIAAAPTPQIIACHPRAVRWLFAVAGAPLPQDGVEFFNMRMQGAKAILEGLDLPKQAARRRAKPTSRLPLPAKKSGEWIPWFPVIDYDRCKNCLQCLQFCLFGVYAEDAEGKVRVVHPDKCKTGCPACARLCPEAAIIFPKYSEGPIAGDDRLPAKAGAAAPVDFSSLAGLDLKEAMRRREAILRAHRKGGHE